MIHKIALGKFELAIADKVAELRHTEAIKDNRKDQHGFDGENGLEIHKAGARSEMALAKKMRVYWNGNINTFGSCCDVGGLQVRTADGEKKHLLVRPGDKDKDIFVYVRGPAPNYDIMGYKKGVDSKIEAWLTDTEDGRPPMYLVPNSELIDITELMIAYHENAIRVLKSRLSR